MNIFQKKNIANSNAQLPIAPIELYQTCSYKEGYSYLRGIQEEVLKIWHERREERDIVCKMSTGAGKTLTGLLMLYSKLVEGVGTCLYVCPDNQLLEQVVVQASNYGIPICCFDGSSFPSEFLNRKAILVCTFHRLFNGKSIFNRDHVKLGAVLLDDAHKCADIAREQTTIKIERGHPISTKLFPLFADDLKFQLPGTYYRLEHEDPLMMMKVPYWVWLSNQDKIIEIISNYVISIEGDPDNNESIKFSWSLIANNLQAYDCYIGGNSVEISPIHAPYHEIASFNEAKHRFILSATFEDSYDLIKDLGISHKSVSSPIVPSGRRDVGKRLIIAPRRYAPEISDDDIRDMIVEYSKTVNAIVLVPSTSKAQEWLKRGAVIVDKRNIEDSIRTLKSSTGNLMVFLNRYDGMDFHNDLCRILVLDGIPKFTSLVEQYYEGRLEPIRASKKAQILEQGLGRATRSGSDYCVTYLLGLELLDFLGYRDNLEYFTPVTRAQIIAGLELLDEEQSDDPIKVIKETSDLCLSQDKQFLEFSNNVILESASDPFVLKKQERLDIAELERKSLEKFRKRKYGEAKDMVVNEILVKDLSDKEKGWYYQFSAHMLYPQHTVESNNLQIRAHDYSGVLFFPKNGTEKYRKVKSKGTQAAAILQKLAKFSTSQDILIYANKILDGLKYGDSFDSKIFEKNLADIGDFLGFATQRPELEIDNGPDVLWRLPNGVFLVMEAKSEAEHAEINRENTNQLLGSEAWFKQAYLGHDDYLLVTLQKTNRKGFQANTNDKFRVLDDECLKKMHANILHFVNGLQGVPTNGHSQSSVEDLLLAHNLTPELFMQHYLKVIKLAR